MTAGIIGLIAGLVIGTMFGVVIMALMVINGGENR